MSARSDLEAIHREHGDRLWWAVLAFCGDREIASDATSEAFAQALRRGGEVREPLAWIWRAAFRIAAGELKERARSDAPFPEPTSELPEPAEHVTQALKQLPTQQRAAVVLHYYADRPIREIAEVLGIRVDGRGASSSRPEPTSRPAWRRRWLTSARISR